MRESSGLRMTLTLLIIGGVCGALLAVFNGLTAPVIEARDAAEFMEALESFFPAVDSYDIQTVDGETFYTITDSGGAFLGVIGKGKASGYGGAILYDLALDNTGSIIGIRISSQGETPGIGDVITRDTYQNLITGLNYNDPNFTSDNRDYMVTGASISTGGMLRSLRALMDIAGANYFN